MYRKKGALKSIAKQMLKSLALLEEMRIIHCDLKPENILFTDETKKSIKLIDFGSACTNKNSNFTYC